MQVRQIVETLRCNNHQAFPITPDVRRAYDSAEPFDLHGVILRVELLKLVLHRIGFFELDASGEIPSSRSHIPTTQTVHPPRILMPPMFSIVVIFLTDPRWVYPCCLLSLQALHQQDSSLSWRACLVSSLHWRIINRLLM